jgi:hypothetical protein
MSRTGATLVALLSLATPVSGQAPACPDSLETRNILAYMVSEAYGAWQRAPDAPVPAGCLYQAIAKSPLSFTDSTILMSLALSGEQLRRSPDDMSTLVARVPLLYRARRYAEVGPAFDALFGAGPSRLTPDAYRLTVAAAMRLDDTSAIVNRLANASQRFGSQPLFRREYDVWRQLKRLRLVVDTVQRRIKAEPSLAEGYSILASVYGNLDQRDSALVYARLALKRGVGRPVVATALESLIGRELRRAQLLGDPSVWQQTLPLALRIDSTLSSPASRYFVALTLAELVADGARLARDIGFGLEAGIPGGFARTEVKADGTTMLRVLTCERLSELRGMVALARAKLSAGGDQFAPETNRTIQSGLDRATAIFSQVGSRCRQ